MLIRFHYVVLCLLLSACGGSTGTDDNTTVVNDEKDVIVEFIGGANRGTLVGEILGNGTILNSTAYNIVSTSVYVPSGTINQYIANSASVVKFAITSYATAKIANVIIPITNTGEARCAINVQVSIVFNDGTPIDTHTTFVMGSKANSFADCLAKNETGYIVVSSFDNFANAVSSVWVDVLSDYTEGYSSPITDPSGGLTPISYANTGSGVLSGSQSFVVTVRNDYDVDTCTHHSSYYIFIDDIGMPVDFGLLKGDSTVPMPPGSTSLLVSEHYYNGAISTVEVFLGRNTLCI